jgi:hypothetical protein
MGIVSEADEVICPFSLFIPYQPSAKLLKVHGTTPTRRIERTTQRIVG